MQSGFGGAEVACWPLIPKFAASNLAEAVGFLKGDKNPQHAFLRKGSKIIGSMSQICGMLKNPGCISQAPFGHHFLPIVPPLAARGLPRVVDARGTWRPKYERLENGELYNKPHWLQCFQGAESAEMDPNPKLLLIICIAHHILFG